jgi:choline dehydrogenase-like flavoprotein
MPSPISANTNATVFAIAERAAELVRATSEAEPTREVAP